LTLKIFTRKKLDRIMIEIYLHSFEHRARDLMLLRCRAMKIFFSGVTGINS
jgi:hypothetical protein